WSSGGVSAGNPYPPGMSRPMTTTSVTMANCTYSPQLRPPSQMSEPGGQLVVEERRHQGAVAGTDEDQGVATSGKAAGPVHVLGLPGALEGEHAHLSGRERGGRRQPAGQAGGLDAAHAHQLPPVVDRSAGRGLAAEAGAGGGAQGAAARG